MNRDRTLAYRLRPVGRSGRQVDLAEDEIEHAAVKLLNELTPWYVTLRNGVIRAGGVGVRYCNVYDYFTTLTWTSVRVGVFRGQTGQLRRAALMFDTKGRKGSGVGFHPDTLHSLG